MSTTATKPWHRSLSACLFIFLHAAAIVLRMQQSQHEIAEALLWLNYSPRAQPALPKIDEGKKKGRRGVSYSSDILRKELLTSCQKPTTPACLIFYEQINKVPSLCVFIDLCKLFTCRYLSGGGKTRLGAWVQVPHTSRASGFSEDSGRRKLERSYYSIIIIQLFENHFIPGSHFCGFL